MTRPSNAARAEKAIDQLPLGSWLDVRTISKNSRFSIGSTRAFLVQARREGKVERRIVKNGFSTLHIWRRVA